MSCMLLSEASLTTGIPCNWFVPVQCFHLHPDCRVFICHTTFLEKETAIRSHKIAYTGWKNQIKVGLGCYLYACYDLFSDFNKNVGGAAATQAQADAHRHMERSLTYLTSFLLNFIFPINSIPSSSWFFLATFRVIWLDFHTQSKFVGDQNMEIWWH